MRRIRLARSHRLPVCKQRRDRAAAVGDEQKFLDIEAFAVDQAGARVALEADRRCKHGGEHGEEVTVDRRDFIGRQVAA